MVGDIAGNSARIAEAIARGTEAGAAIVLTPELAVTGYPPEDLLLRPRFAADARAAVDEIAAGVRSGVAIVGFPEWDRDCHNSAAVVADGRVQAVYRKRFLPNYGVFDEARYFQAGERGMVVCAGELRIGVVVCEDVWYPGPIANDLASAGLDVVCCISASPYHRQKGDARESMLATRASDAAAPLLFCNQVGGQDELVFDGRSAAFDAAGRVVARAHQFREELLIADLRPDHTRRRRLTEPLVRRLPPSGAEEVRIDPGPPPPPEETEASSLAPLCPPEEEVWGALVTGIRDYVDKNGFPGVLIGLSGGIDSSLTAALAVDALGPDRVTGVGMPSAVSSPLSLECAQALANSLGTRLIEVPVAPIVAAFEAALEPAFGGRGPDVTEENLQARARGTALMALSNKLGLLVLAPGNKSEMSVGYSTLYGDMVGGFAPLRDVAKTWVYRLARWRNADQGREVIPQQIIDRPPTAELRPGQLDTDSLPPYDLLDRVIEGYVEEGLDVEEMAGAGLPAKEVERVIRMVDQAEYKRRQGPVGIKITPRAFGKDRRMPITNRYG